MKTYPYKKLPFKVQKYLNGEIVDLDELIFPTRPTFKKYDYSGFLITIALAGIILLLIIFNVRYWLVYPVLGYITIWAASSSIGSFKYTKQENKVLREKYQNEVDIVNAENAKRNRLKRELKRNGEEQSYIKEKIKEELRSFREPQLVNWRTKKGLSESYFIRFLFDYFKEAIKPFTKLYGDNAFENDYQPDFVFQNRNICIDIEIDEPYVMDDRKPIHILDEEKDDFRDNFFINLNWCVIRFSEEQILIYPYECCKYIAQLIFDLTADDQYLKRLNFRSMPPTVNKWTKSEAEKMAKEKLRELFYLKATHQASQPEYFPVNYFEDKKILLTKIGEWKANYHLCFNNNIYGPSTIACNKFIVPEFAFGQTIEFEIDNFILENDYLVHILPTSFDENIPEKYEEYKEPITRIDKQKS